MAKRLLLGSAYSVIEPLGLMHLAGVAKQEGWEPKIVMVKDDDFRKFDEQVKDFSPDVLGFSIYTGDHTQVFDYLDGFRTVNNIPVVVGGPHPTYFPRESEKHADYVVLSEGFNGSRRILRGEVKPGIVPLEKQEPFPLPDREGFYRDNPDKRKSPIKSIMTHVGCPYKCTYCYNSSTLEGIASELTPRELAVMEKSLGGRKSRLFPGNKRRVEDVIAEVQNILDVSPETRMIYFQDDVFGSSTDWVEDFARWQVLLIPPEPEPDVTGLRGMPGVTGELRSHLLAIAGKDPEVHQAVMADRAATDAQDVQAFVEARYQNCWWYLRTLDALRIGLDDWDRDQDWSRPFSHAMCAWSEQQFRMMLDLPSALPGEPPVAAMMYWTLRDAVLAGERNPVHHWQEHYR
ncbi:MAG: cobalamin-dependent protein, partial [archaeon]|nr:cobalamin-dependent protein [archaeon]